MLRELLHLLVPLRQKLERRRRPYRSTLRRSLPQFQPARFLFDGSRASTATRLLDPMWNKGCRFFEVHDTASGHTARPQICRLTRLPARHASCTLPRRESCSTPITHKTRPAMSSLSMIPPRPSPSRTILTSALFLPCSSSMALASEAVVTSSIVECKGRDKTLIRNMWRCARSSLRTTTMHVICRQAQHDCAACGVP